MGAVAAAGDCDLGRGWRFDPSWSGTGLELG